MSNNPFENNPNYKRLFQITSNQSACGIFERVELYKSNLENSYVLFRYTVDNMTMPIRTILRLSNLIYSEVIQEGGKVNLYVVTNYKDLVVAGNRVNLCCGQLPYVLQVEKALYDYLLN